MRQRTWVTCYSKEQVTAEAQRTRTVCLATNINHQLQLTAFIALWKYPPCRFPKALYKGYYSHPIASQHKVFSQKVSSSQMQLAAPEILPGFADRPCSLWERLCHFSCFVLFIKQSQTDKALTETDVLIPAWGSGSSKQHRLHLGGFRGVVVFFF